MYIIASSESSSVSTLSAAVLSGWVDDTGCVDGRCYVRVGGDCLGCLRRNGEWILDLYFV